jgi:hypothetical protein
MHRNDERVWLPELMQLKLSTLEKLVSIFANGQIYIFCTNKEQVTWQLACTCCLWLVCVCVCVYLLHQQGAGVVGGRTSSVGCLVS